MQYELYIDIFFLENFVMDYLILVTLKKTMKRSTAYTMICLGALVGAFLSGLVICVPIPMGVKRVLLHTVVNSLMLIIGLKLRSWNEFVKGYLSLYIISFLFGGVFSFLREYFGEGYRVGSLFVTLTIISYFLVRKSIDILAGLVKIPKQYCEVTLYLNGKECCVRALVDSGNHLTDQITGKAVHIVSVSVIEKLAGKTGIQKIRYVPYCTIQEERGILPVIKIDKMKIHMEKEWEVFSPLIGISSQDQFAGGMFEMILHPKDC